MSAAAEAAVGEIEAAEPGAGDTLFKCGRVKGLDYLISATGNLSGAHNTAQSSTAVCCANGILPCCISTHLSLSLRGRNRGSHCSGRVYLAALMMCGAGTVLLTAHLSWSRHSIGYTSCCAVSDHRPMPAYRCELTTVVLTLTLTYVLDCFALCSATPRSAQLCLLTRLTALRCVQQQDRRQVSAQAAPSSSPSIWSATARQWKAEG